MTPARKISRINNTRNVRSTLQQQPSQQQSWKASHSMDSNNMACFIYPLCQAVVCACVNDTIDFLQRLCDTGYKFAKQKPIGFSLI